MTSFYPAIRTALRERLRLTEGLPEVAWENLAFAPGPGVAHLRERLTVEGSRLVALRQAREDFAYHLDIYHPADRATDDADDLAGLLVEWTFAPGLRLAGDGHRAVVARAERRGGEPRPGGWYVVPVAIALWAHRSLP
ncbi:MAG: hypothetical protein OHK0024_21420 [Thalassobaculales bacterium]